MALKRMKKTVAHTRIVRSCNITNIRVDPYNPMTLIVDFEHTIPTNYYQRELDIIYAIYLDREFIKEFLEKSTKFQLANIDVNSVLEVFAHPHGGFQFIRNRQTPGNKIRIVFQSKDPATSDVSYHNIYWDNKTGTILAKRIGQIDAVTGVINGVNLKSGSISQ